MSQVSEAIHKHHRKLVKTLATHVEALVEGRPEGDPKALARFLREELLPHAVGEEKHLYPSLEPVIKSHGQATATMRIDHEFIHAIIRRIEKAVEAMESAGPERPPALQRELRHLALQFEAVLRLHLEKEERVYLPLFEKHLSEEEQQRVLDGMHSAYQEPPSAGVKTELDVRWVPPPQRHPLIFQTFDDLPPGEAFVLVNDHDPKPLYYQFTHEREGQFTWEYLEQGPEVWRVRIGRLSAGRR